MKREPRKVPAAVPQDEWLSEQLRDRELAVAYLNAALEEGDQAAFMLALRDVAKAGGGVAMLARLTGMNRVALSRALSVTGNPELRNLTRILDASGLRFVIAAKQTARRKRGKVHARSAA
jgi:probable addiction module antidote protein